MVSISEIIAGLVDRGETVTGEIPAGLAVTGISDDSRAVRAGDLYCAIRGQTHDGHRFVEDAARAGAVAALVESPVRGVAIPQIRVGDTRRAAAIAAHCVFGEPSRGLVLIGVTGTNGKTTTVQLIRHILSDRYPTGSIGTLGVIDPSGTREPTSLTTPGPVELARDLAWLRHRGAGVVVMEVSSHGLAQKRMAGVQFDAAVFTNLSRDHLDYHADEESYRSAKLRLADRIKRYGTIIFNADDPAWSVLADRPGRLRFGLDEDAEYTVRDLTLGTTGSKWILITPAGEIEVSLPLVGEFNVSNALAAAAVGGALGLAVGELAEGLSTVAVVPGRLEPLGESPTVLRDYAHTPDALREVLRALRPLTRGRLIVVFGCGGDRDPGKRPLMGRAVAEGADLAIVTSDNPRHEDPGRIIDQIVPGLSDAPYERIDDRRAAIARALEIAVPDDVVLLAGKGHETYQIVGDERRPMDEREIVAELRAASGGRPR